MSVTGLDRTYISLVENGKRSPSLSTILKISSALGTDPSKLFTVYEKTPAYQVRREGK
jgi:transcriptional regulator with XRE-family HTH domain